LIHKHVKKLNLIMENTFFTDKINSLVFQIVKMDILEPEKPKCQPFCDRNLDSSPFLDVQSQADHSDFCLAYAFTYRDWTEGTLGVAWIAGLNQAGGICEDHKRASFVEGYRSRNTGVVTLKNSGRRIPIPKSELTFSHEVGHNLGSPHDEDKGCLLHLPMLGMAWHSHIGGQANCWASSKSSSNSCCCPAMGCRAHLLAPSTVQATAGACPKTQLNFQQLAHSQGHSHRRTHMARGFPRRWTLNLGSTKWKTSEAAELVGRKPPLNPAGFPSQSDHAAGSPLPLAWVPEN